MLSHAESGRIYTDMLVSHYRLHGILRILFALNRQWEPVWKWLKEITSPLPLNPVAFQPRLTALFSTERVINHVADCFQLMQETLDLVPASIDTEQARLAVRQSLSQQRRDLWVPA